jgi:hypothetical protein
MEVISKVLRRPSTASTASSSSSRSRRKSSIDILFSKRSTKTNKISPTPSSSNLYSLAQSPSQKENGKNAREVRQESPSRRGSRLLTTAESFTSSSKKCGDWRVETCGGVKLWVNKKTQEVSINSPQKVGPTSPNAKKFQPSSNPPAALKKPVAVQPSPGGTTTVIFDAGSFRANFNENGFGDNQNLAHLRFGAVKA